MSAPNRLFSPFKKAVAAFFKHDLALKRDEAGVRLVLEDRHAPAPPARPLTRTEAAAQRDERLLKLACRQLAEALDADAEGRAVLRHLAFLEHKLNKRGWRALQKVPLDVLRKALDQLEGMVTNWSPEGLAALRSKMAVAVMAREEHDDEAQGDTDLSRLESVLDTPSQAATQAIDAAAASSSEVVDESQALLAAYAALGEAAPSSLELHGELGSKSARSANGPRPRTAPVNVDIRLRDVQA